MLPYGFKEARLRATEEDWENVRTKMIREAAEDETVFTMYGLQNGWGFDDPEGAGEMTCEEEEELAEAQLGPNQVEEVLDAVGCTRP